MLTLFRKVKELLGRIDNHVDMLDDLAERVEKAIKVLRGHYGY